MDKLQECAKAFQKLLDTQYHIIIGRKGKAVDLEINFDSVDFHHLIGLHKLKDIEALSGKREAVFRSILAGYIPISSIAKSLYFSQIENRMEPFSALEKIFDDNRLVFKYNKKAHSFSLIQAEYLLTTPYKNNEVYIFLDKKENEGQYFCRSFFPKENKDYTIGQPAYTLLFKEKITISTGEKEVQYDHLSPVQKKNDLMTEQITAKTSVPAAPATPQSAADIFKAAREKAARVNAAADRQQPDKSKNKGQEIK